MLGGLPGCFILCNHLLFLLKPFGPTCHTAMVVCSNASQPPESRKLATKLWLVVILVVLMITLKLNSCSTEIRQNCPLTRKVGPSFNLQPSILLNSGWFQYQRGVTAIPSGHQVVLVDLWPLGKSIEAMAPFQSNGSCNDYLSSSGDR